MRESAVLYGKEPALPWPGQCRIFAEIKARKGWVSRER